MKAFIHSTAYYLPETKLSNEELLQQFPEWQADKVVEKVGIKSRHISGDDEFCSDMAVKAATKLFNEYNIDKSSIDFLLLCTQSPDYLVPTTACIIQHKLSLPLSVGAIDINQGCSGFVYGLAIAKSLITSGTSKNVLLITSETYTKLINDKDKSNRIIFGDAATATLVSTEGMFEIQDFVFGTDGSGYKNLIANNGAINNYYSIKHKSELKESTQSPYLFMNGIEIFNFTLGIVPKLVQDVIRKNKFHISNISHFIFHQANTYMLEHLRKKINIEESKFEYFIEDCGNTVSSTIPIVIKELGTREKLKSNSKIVLAGFGVGYSWAACVITKAS